MNEIVIVGQDEGAPLLHLQAVLTAGDSLAAVHLGGLEVLRTQPGLINHLCGRQREVREGRGERERQVIDELGIICIHKCKRTIHDLYSYQFTQISWLS